MFKKYFLLAILSCALSVSISMVYTQIYYSRIVDFSQGLSMSSIVLKNIIASMSACFLFFVLNKLIKKSFLAEFIFNGLVFMVTFSAIFYVLEIQDPEFKDENIAIMVDYFKCFLMPVIFFPALSWYSIKPLFFKH